jgi:hypothetical protein
VQAIPQPTTIDRSLVTPIGVRYHDAPETGEPRRPFVNFAHINLGRIAARGTSALGYLKVFDTVLSADEENLRMSNLKSEKAFPDPRTTTNELSPLEYAFMSGYNKDPADDAKIQDVKDGTKYLYAFSCLNSLTRPCKTMSAPSWRSAPFFRGTWRLLDIAKAITRFMSKRSNETNSPLFSQNKSALTSVLKLHRGDPSQFLSLNSPTLPA